MTPKVSPAVSARKSRSSRMRAVVPELVEKESIVAQIIDLRRSGTPWRAVAEVVGVAPSTARTWHVEAISAYVDDDTRAAALAEDLDRLDGLISSWWRPATEGLDPQAAIVILKVLDRRARLLGLDAAQKVDVRAVTADEIANVEARLSEWLEAHGAPA
jgi:hypothetical protein